MNLLDLNNSPVCVIINTSNQERFIGSMVIQALRLTSFVGVIDQHSHDRTVQVATAAGAVLLATIQGSGFDADVSEEALTIALKWANNQNAKELIFLEKTVQWSDLAGLFQITNYSLTVTADIIVVNSPALSVPSLSNPLQSKPYSSVCAWAFSSKAINCLKDQHFDVALLPVQFEKHNLVVAQLISGSLTINRDREVVKPLEVKSDNITRFARFIGQHRPLLFFGLPGLLCLMLGLIIGIFTSDIYYKTHSLAISYALLAVLMVIIGTLGLFVGLILHSVKAFVLNLKRLIEVSHNPNPDGES